MQINTSYSETNAVSTQPNNSVEKNESNNQNATTPASAGVDVGPAAVYEKSKGTESPKEYKPDPAKVKKMMDEMNSKEESLRTLIRKLLNKQAEKNSIANGTAKEDAMSDLLNAINSGKEVVVEVDAEAQKQAQAELSEDGYYGVKKTTERIMDFAKAITGGNPAQAEDMRKAVQEGFKEAEQMWGGKLPQITQDTYDSIMKEFDAWAAEGKKSEPVVEGITTNKN